MTAHGTGADRPGGGLNTGEILCAVLLVALGLYMVRQGFVYGIGSVTQMGAGFFPAGIGLALAGLGIALVFEVARLPVLPIELRARPFVMVFAGLVAFALLIERAGLVPATVALVVLSALADRPIRPMAILGSTVVLAATGYFVFIYGLGVPIPAFAW